MREKPSAKVYEEAGDWLMQRGNVHCALVAFEEAVQLQPNSAMAHYKLGESRVRAHQLSAATDEFRLALQYEPGMTMAHSSLGSALMDLGQPAKAESEFREALGRDPQFIPALVGLGMIQANKDNNQEAEKLFRQAVQDDPKYEKAHLNLGLILAKEQKFNEAEVETDMAMKLAPRDPAALAAAGRVRARLGKSDEGVALLREAVALPPQSAMAHLELGMVLADNYDLTGALAEHSKAVRLAPRSALAHFNRGRVLFDLGRTKEAKSELELAKGIDAQMAEPNYFLALIEKQSGNYKQVARLLQTLVKLQPRNTTAWLLLGQSWEHESQTQEAIAAWRQALAIDPDNSRVIWSLAHVIKPTDPDEAGRLMARYAEVQKQHRIVDEAGTLGNDALAAGAGHDWPEAIRQFQKAIEVCGDCAIKADLHKKLGLTLCQMGDIDNGEKELRLAQALKPADPDIERVLKRIALARGQRALTPPQPDKEH